MARVKFTHERCCNFCGKAQDEVAVLISGPGVWICDSCVALCCEIIDEGPLPAPLNPAEGVGVRTRLRDRLVRVRNLHPVVG